MRNGSAMSVEMVGLGWHWYPYRYTRTRDDGDGGRAPRFPAWLGQLSRRAVADAVAVDPLVAAGARAFDPDVALINWYGPGARWGCTSTATSVASAPVVSFSVGATGTSDSGTRADVDVRGSTCPWSRGTWSSSAARRGWPTTGCSASCRARTTRQSGPFPAGST